MWINGWKCYTFSKEMVIIEIKKNSEEIGKEQIRRHFDEKTGKWYFSIVDVIGILTESSDPRNYWKVLKNRLNKTHNELVTKCNQLKMRAKDGKYYFTDVADSEIMEEILKQVPKVNLKKLDSPLEGNELEAKLLIDAYETETEIFIEAMVAGVEENDINIQVTKNKVFINGRRDAPSPLQGEGRGKVHQELLWGNFSRTVSLPCPVQTEKFETTEERGWLKIKLFKI